MDLNRRDLLKIGATSASLIAVPSLAGPVWSKNSIKANGIQIDSVSDGHLQLPTSFLFGSLPKETYEPVLKAYKISMETQKRDCNLTLLRDGKRTILFDVGSGPNFMPTAGKIADALDHLGVSMEDVTDVVFTHAHPDHLWGVLDEFEEPLFPNAKYMISEKEWAYWTDPKTITNIEESRKSFAAGAKRLLSTIEKDMKFFKYGEEILPNIASIDTSGHTPGHTSFEVKMGSENLVIVGDAISNHHMSFEKPAVSSGSDQDKDQGVKSRKSLLDKLAHEKSKLIGFHLPSPGIGFAEKKGNAYRFVADSSAK